MVKPLFRARLLATIAGTLFLAFLIQPKAFCQDSGELEAATHNRQGMEYFNKGFYDHAPKNQGDEAEKNYKFAVKEFKDAISRDSSSIEAHRNLARVYYVRKNFEGASEEYRRVTELAPSDLDAYVNCALASIELKRFDAAIETLENAKGQTSDPQALETLDTYIAKVRGLQEKEVR